MLREGPGHPDESHGHRGGGGGSYQVRGSTGRQLAQFILSINSGDSCSYSLGIKGFLGQG